MIPSLSFDLVLLSSLNGATAVWTAVVQPDKRDPVVTPLLFESRFVGRYEPAEQVGHPT